MGEWEGGGGSGGAGAGGAGEAQDRTYRLRGRRGVHDGRVSGE